MRFSIFLTVAYLAHMAVAFSPEKKIVCYFGSWSVYRPEGGKFAIENIDPKLCTHLIYTFVGIHSSEVKVLDAWQDLSENYGKSGFQRFNALRKMNPELKTLVAIGGWNEGSEKYSKMASDPSSRTRFINNALAFVKKHDFDGFDLDWEYPAQRGGSAADVRNFVALIKEMREVFDNEGLLLTAAVGAAESSASQSYDIPSLSKYLHFINLMTYDLHGSWEPQTGINAPLYSGSSDTGFSKQLTVDAAVKYWLSKGADPSKLIVGVPSYGRTFTLANPSVHGVHAPTRGPGAAGIYTRENGFLGYNEICDMERKNELTVVWDEERRVPFGYHGDQWVGFDNDRSITEKAEYIKKMGLGGAMVWSIETDDFKGNCGETYPLIKALNRVLRDGVDAPEVPTRRPTTTERITTTRPTYEKPKITVHTTEGPAVTHGPKTTTPSSHQESGPCKTAGIIVDPTNCEHFFQCVPRSAGGFTKLTIPCPPGLCFKPKLGICDWK